MDKRIKVVKSDVCSTEFESRYVVVDLETGEIVDDAQGYGYKTQRNAYAAYAYKTRDKSKELERKNREIYIRQWMKEHKSFVRFIDEIAIEIVKGS